MRMLACFYLAYISLPCSARLRAALTACQHYLLHVSITYMSALLTACQHYVSRYVRLYTYQVHYMHYFGLCYIADRVRLLAVRMTCQQYLLLHVSITYYYMPALLITTCQHSLQQIRVCKATHIFLYIYFFYSPCIT
jgi:hypothetical protein